MSLCSLMHCRLSHLSDRSREEMVPKKEKAPPKRGQAHEGYIAEGILWGLPQQDNSARGDWFQKEKPRRGDGAKSQDRDRGAGIATNRPHLFTFAGQHVRISGRMSWRG